jgi:membrane-bound lytic murein transglycosylase B
VAWEHLQVPDHQGPPARRHRRLPGGPAALLAAGLLLAACSPPAGPADRPAAAPATAPATTATSSPATATTTTPPASPAARLAAEISAAETAIRNPATPSSRLPALGRAQQQAYRTIIRRPGLLREVLPLLPPALRRVARANVTAGSELRKLSRPRPRLPRWRIVAPVPAATLLADYRAAEAELGVPWQYLAAIHLVETRVGRIRGVSTAGARGPMQFLPPTWRRYGGGGDINASRDAVFAAARLLRANGAPGDMTAALYAYNHSGRYVRAVTAYAEQIRGNQRVFLGYYHWQVYYGDTLLPEGYPARPASRSG